VNDPILITVYGSPKPKGSLRHVGHGRMVEQLAGSKPWREAVKWAAVEANVGTVTGPVLVDVVVTVTKPHSAPKRRRTWPITRSSGDVDKHLRNVLDALVDAAVLPDDSQVITATITKAYPGEEAGALDQPGARIAVHRIGGEEATDGAA
jgi:Holliday junction resolvase RusA-like endonuclease